MQAILSFSSNLHLSVWIIYPFIQPLEDRPTDTVHDKIMFLTSLTGSETTFKTERLKEIIIKTDMFSMNILKSGFVPSKNKNVLRITRLILDQSWCKTYEAEFSYLLHVIFFHIGFKKALWGQTTLCLRQSKCYCFFFFNRKLSIQQIQQVFYSCHY